ncbi:capsid cement protein [Microbacterium karelineae]|uniref:capsid cement protein n=1 Tax=Microbacterium karelineae TaxID=2654283 RepID=UPI0012EA41FF|nr:capsid cement protein [Microbacterium karelineae]
MTGYLPKHNPGAAITIPATAAITGGQLVTAAGEPAGADATTVIGVAARDVTTGENVTVYSGGVQRLVASAAIAQGDLVKAAADGQIAVYTAGTDSTDTLLGVALAAAALGELATVKFLR